MHKNANHHQKKKKSKIEATKPKRDLRENALLVGEQRQVDQLEKVLTELNVTFRKENWSEDMLDHVDDSTLALILVSPIDGMRMSRAVKHVRDHMDTKSDLSIFAVIPEVSSNSEIRNIYRTGASAVVEWPREKKILPQLIAELIGIERVRGKASKPETAQARLIKAHLKQVSPRYQRVQVRTQKGIVFLSGMVDDLWRKEGIEDTVIRIPGVKGVVSRRLMVSPSGIPDKMISRTVKTLLKGLSVHDLSTISIDVQSGFVTVVGSVSEKNEVKHLIDILRGIKGVRGIRNHVIVSPSQRRGDSVIAKKVKKIMKTLYPEKDVAISVFNGVAVLSGGVESFLVKRSIEEIVSQENSIDRVINKIEVG